MTPEELQKLIEDGEDSYTEFKTEAVHPQSLAEEIVAFANFKGGRILLGVDDDGGIAGVTRPDMDQIVVNVCRNLVRPPLIPDLTRVRVGDKLVWIVTIERGAEVYATTRGQHFVRMGASKQLPTLFELVRLLQNRRLMAYDETPAFDTTAADLDGDRINRYLARIGQAPLPGAPMECLPLLANLKLATPGTSTPTLAGFLAFGRGDRIAVQFPALRVATVHYAGNAPDATVVDKWDGDGALEEQIEGALLFLRRNMRVAERYSSTGQRQDVPEYDVRALREAVVNAVAHRDYTLLGAGIRVLMFADRVDILSPGGLPNTLTLENIRTIQYARNPLITSFLAGLGYMERRGEGIVRMERYCQEQGLPAPEFALDDPQQFRVTFFKAPAPLNTAD